MNVRVRVATALEAVPRDDFLPADQRDRAHLDVPLPIGHDATNSQPSTVRVMLELLDAQPGDTVLDVGAGSGWTTALLAHLVGPTGHVIGVDVVPALVETARAGLAGLPAPGMPWATVEVAVPGILGWPAQAPYRRILVSAMARQLPEALTDQLEDGGRMVIPVASQLVVAERRRDRVRTRLGPGRYRFVPLQQTRS